MRPNRELVLVLVSGMFLLAGYLVHQFDGPTAVRVALLCVSAVLSSTTTFPEALHLLRRFKLDVDVLMFAAAIGAATLGHFEEGALLLFLFGLGSAGESMATGRSRRAIEALTHLAPESVLKLDDDNRETLVRIEQLAVGDRVLLKPFDRVGIDGEILDGASELDESSLTGESVPVSKKPGEMVYAGTLNGSGRLVVRVTRPASESTLSRIVKLVEEAQSQKGPTQLFTDRVEAVYVPCVFVVTLLLIVIPPLAGWTPRTNPQSLWGGWFYQSMAFLTAASPCALAIGTPTAILCGIARAARMGVLIKGGAHLEALGKLRAIAFDKTGTLTTGLPSVDRIVSVDGVSADEALTLAAAVDAHATHPFARSIVEAAGKNGSLPPADDVKQIAGEGAVGVVAGRRIAVGKSTLAGHIDAWPDTLEQAHKTMQSEGLTTAFVMRDDTPIGVIGLLDKPREFAIDAIRQLRGSGVEHLVMLTGDHAAVAHQVAGRVGIVEQDVYADLLPQQKLQQIDTLVKRYGSVAMIGDGVNDAPALAKATLGIAMGAAHAGRQHASDVAIETADVVLMGSDLRRLSEAVDLAKRARFNIAQNLFIALGVIGIVAPLAALGYARLGWAVLLHEGSTVVVVLNALRLLRR